jgi:hypothetical protein
MHSLSPPPLRGLSVHGDRLPGAFAPGSSNAAPSERVSVSEMMDLLAAHGIPADLGVEDYRESLLALREIW